MPVQGSELLVGPPTESVVERPVQPACPKELRRSLHMPWVPSTQPQVLPETVPGWVAGRAPSSSALHQCQPGAQTADAAPMAWLYPSGVPQPATPGNWARLRKPVRSALPAQPVTGAIASGGGGGGGGESESTGRSTGGAAASIGRSGAA